MLNQTNTSIEARTMDNDMSTTSAALAPATKLFGVGADLLGQVEKMVGNNKVSGLKVKLGNRVIKEIPLQSAKAVVTIGLALLAVILSQLTVEVEHEPLSAAH